MANEPTLEEIKNYLTLKEEYRKKVNEIKNA